MNVFLINADGTVTPWHHDSSEGEEAESEYYYTVTEDDLNASYAEIYALQPETDFRVIAYSADGEYRGRRDFRTQAAEVFANPDLVVDLRMEDNDTLKASLFEILHRSFYTEDHKEPDNAYRHVAQRQGYHHGFRHGG